MATPQEVKQEQIVRLAPFQEEFLADIFASGKALTGPGSQMPYADQKIADLTDAQRQAISQSISGVGAYSPYLQRGSEALGQGIGAVGAGLGTLGSALGQLPEAQQGYRQQQQAMLDAQRLGQQGVGQAQAMTAGADFDFFFHQLLIEQFGRPSSSYLILKLLLLTVQIFYYLVICT